MQIVLMRHGRPLIDSRRRLHAAAFAAWVERYDAAGIDAAWAPPLLAIERARQCTFVVCSDLARSWESASAVGLAQADVCSPMFREMEMPAAAWRFPKLSLPVWSVFFRLLWVFGYSAGAESFTAAKARARDCAEQLADWASVHGSVLFVGHGSLNWFIARHLKRMGWSCPTRPPRRYWEYSVHSIAAG